jgi:carboxyl-terminal processing protease
MLASLNPYTVYFNRQDLAFQNYWRIYWNFVLTRKKDLLINVKEVYKIFQLTKRVETSDEITKLSDIELSEYKEETNQLFKALKNTKIDIKYLRQAKVNS